ncbi:MAG: PAS domain S-box protein [Nitrososphaeria archaeon]
MFYGRGDESGGDKSVSNVPLKVALIYSIFGYSWIIITDAIVFDPKTFAFNIVFQISVLKGIVFVLITSLIIYYLLHKGTSILVKEREEFRNKEEMYRRFLDNINGVAVQVDRNLKPVFIHGNFETITGYSLNELFSSESVLENLLPQEEKKRFYETVNRLFTESNLEVEGDYQVVRKDGKRIWVKVFLRNVCDEHGIPQYIQALYFDITESKQMEGELKASEEKFRTVVESMSDIVFILDRYQRHVSVFGQWSKIYKTSPEAFLGKTARDVFGDEAAKVHEEANIKALQGENVTYEWSTKTAEGKTLYFQTSLSPLRDSKGNIIGIVGVGRDITKLKEAEEKLQEYTRNLEKLLEERTRQLRESERLAAIGEATMMVGHDLRNPLQAIINNVYIIKSKFLDKLPKRTKIMLEKEGLEDILKRIENEISYMNKIVRDLQDYSKPITPKYSRIRLQQMIEKILSQIILSEKIVVRKEINVEEIVCDEMLLERILYNLILNAVQAMPEGGILTIRGEKVDDNIVLAVEDTGAGIPENILPKLFTPFFTTKAKGQGLGLAICKRFIEILNGKIDVRSEVGKGSKFTITIPISTLRGAR